MVFILYKLAFITIRAALWTANFNEEWLKFERIYEIWWYYFVYKIVNNMSWDIVQITVCNNCENPISPRIFVHSLRQRKWQPRFTRSPACKGIPRSIIKAPSKAVKNKITAYIHTFCTVFCPTKLHVTLLDTGHENISGIADIYLNEFQPHW